MTGVFKMWKEMSHFSEERVAKSKERVTESQERMVEASLLVAESREVGPTKSAIDPKALVRVSISVFGIFWIVGLAKRARQHALEVFPSMS